MSLVKIQGNPSGTGAFTIAAPNSNTDRTLTLPDATGTLIPGTIDGSGNVAFAGGIYLGGSGSANLLDDYEEGTFTPAFSSGSGITYVNRSGYYTKIGNVVMFHFFVQWSAGTSLSAAFTGLPFSVANLANAFTMCPVWNDTGTTYAAGRTTLIAYGSVNTSTVTIETVGSATSASAPSLSTSGALYVTGHYYTT